MRRFLILLASMFLLVFPEPGCSSSAYRSHATISPSQTRFLSSSNTPGWYNSITPIETYNFNSTSIIVLTLDSSMVPAPRFTSVPTHDPVGCVPTDVEIEYGLVKWVPDGDTVVVDIQGKLHTVKYLGVEAPANIGYTEYGGPNAARFNQKLTQNQLVDLVKDGMDRDSSGQLLRYVFVGDLFLNYELVRQGLARAVVEESDIACEGTFLQAEDLAKQEVLGIWEATRTPHRTYIPTKSLTAIIFSGSPSPSVQTNQFTPTSTLTPMHTSSSTITLTPSLTPTFTYTISPTPELTATNTLTTTGGISIFNLAYNGGFVEEVDNHD